MFLPAKPSSRPLRVPREIAALLRALQLGRPDASQLHALTDTEWKSLLEFSDLAHLTLSLAQLDQQGFPDWVRHRLEKNLADNAARFDLVANTYQEAATALELAGVDYLVLKGFTQSPEYVPGPRLRMQSDLDLYCPQEEVPAARAALEAIGYVSDHQMDYSHADHVPTLYRKGRWTWRGNMFDPEMPLSIELHFCLWNEAELLFPAPQIDTFWNRKKTRILENISFPALDPIDQLGYTSLHILRDLLTADWMIHHVYELAFFLHHHARDHAFWTRWEELHPERLRQLQAVAFFLARDWFGCNLSAENKTQIHRLPAEILQWLERFSGSPIEGMFKQNKTMLWMHTALLGTSGRKWPLVRHKLLPVIKPRINSPSLKWSYRRPRKIRHLPPRLRYLVHFASRVLTHTRLVPATLFQGLVWKFHASRLPE